MQFLDHLPGIFANQLVLLFQATVEEQAVADQVDPAWHTCTVPVDQAQSTFTDCRIPLPAHMTKSMLHVGHGLFKIQWFKMRGGNETLLEMLHTRRMDHVQQGLLSDQKHLHQ